MATSRDDRVPLILAGIAAAAIVTAVFLRPEPLPSGVARFSMLRTEALAGAAPGRSYALDVILAGDRQFHITHSALAVPAGGTITITGWALDWRTMKPVTRVLVTVDGGRPNPVTDSAVARPDVAALLHDSDTENSGFQARIGLAGLRPGLHHIVFSVVDRHGVVDTLPSEVRIVIAPEVSRSETDHHAPAATPR